MKVSTAAALIGIGYFAMSVTLFLINKEYLFALLYFIPFILIFRYLLRNNF